MVTGPDFVREMRRGEEAAVDTLLALAFEGKDEGRLVRQLRKDRDIAGESVLGWQGEIIGYFALSVMRAPKKWLCLAPVAIHPDWQRKRHGRRMIGLLSEWARLADRTIVVLGQPEFYQRCGFSKDRAARLTSPYPIDHTMLAGPGTDAPQVELKYPRAFGAN